MSEHNGAQGALFHSTSKLPDDVRSLAYIGDAVCHLYVRQWLVGDGGNVRGLTKRAAAYACAHGQSLAYETIAPQLTDEESTIFRRGRNAKCGVVPKNADPIDYRKATGFETLMGWLYLTGQSERLEALLRCCYEPRGEENGTGHTEG